MNTLLDVVVVPNFCPANAVLFEARTLFFLASWLERAGERAKREFALHLACIGEPPPSVKALATQCGASISQHEPLALNDGSFANKLRGFEIARTAERLLLIDADILVLNDIGNLVVLVPVGALSIAPANYRRVPDEYWEVIYPALDLPLPTERILCEEAKVGLTKEPPMFPYYNSGVVMVPRDCEFPRLWAQDITAIRNIFSGEESNSPIPPIPTITDSDQEGGVVALGRMVSSGWPLHPLPTTFNARPLHFKAGALHLDQVQLFHALGFMSGLENRADIESFMEHFISAWGTLIRTGAHHQRQKPSLFTWWKARVQGRKEARQAAQFLRHLWETHVQPALLLTGESEDKVPGVA